MAFAHPVARQGRSGAPHRHGEQIDTRARAQGRRGRPVRGPSCGAGEAIFGLVEHGFECNTILGILFVVVLVIVIAAPWLEKM